ncbi:unnamed protein product, partial [Sphacelaria rigidula]
SDIDYARHTLSVSPGNAPGARAGVEGIDAKVDAKEKETLERLAANMPPTGSMGSAVDSARSSDTHEVVVSFDRNARLGTGGERSEESRQSESERWARRTTGDDE